MTYINEYTSGGIGDLEGAMERLVYSSLGLLMYPLGLVAFYKTIRNFVDFWKLGDPEMVMPYQQPRVPQQHSYSYCPFCGSSNIPSGATFCPSCGKSFGAPPGIS
ncbi:MAG: zinc ribbon domain-containing protein [Candidatus Thorarchaeota archaeon]